MVQPSTETLEEAPPTGFARKSAVAFAGQVVAFASNLAVGILVARLLGTEGKGAYALIRQTAIIAFLLVTLGVPSAVTFYVGRYKWPPVRTFLLGSACALVAVLLLLFTMQALGPERVLKKAAFSPEIVRLTWLMLVLGLPLQVLGSTVAAVLRGRELIVETVWPGMVTSVLRTGLVAGLLLVRREVVTVVFTELAAVALWTFLIVVVFREALRAWPPACGNASIKALVLYGSQMQAGSIISILWARGDLYFVNYFLGVAATGVYSVAMAFAEFASFPNQAITSVLFPRLALCDSAVRTDQTLKAHRAAVLISAATGLALAGASALIPVVYGRSFAPAIPAALICLSGSVFLGGLNVLYYFFAAQEKQLLNVAARSSGLACMVALDLLLIPRLGIVGAAFAYATSLVWTYVCTLWLAFRFSLLRDTRALIPGWRDVVELARAIRGTLRVSG
jgi:O-antigen/teichoic acid export membrane protein